MPKDSQIDKKNTRQDKANGDSTVARENQNQNKSAKKQSVKNNDV